jgi:hypothetical protein
MNLMVCCVTSAAGSAEAARSIRQNHMLRCTSIYISITQCGLTEAQKFIKALTTELQLGIQKNWQRDTKRDIEFDFRFPNWSEC